MPLQKLMLPIMLLVLFTVPLSANHKTEIIVRANCFSECKPGSTGRIWVEVPVVVVTDPFSALGGQVTWTKMGWSLPGIVGVGFFAGDMNAAFAPPEFALGKDIPAGPFEFNFCEHVERYLPLLNITLDAPAVWSLEINMVGEIDSANLPLPENFVPTVPWIKNFTGSFRRSSRSPGLDPNAFFDPIRGQVTGIAKTECQLTNVVLEPIDDPAPLVELGPGCKQSGSGLTACVVIP